MVDIETTFRIEGKNHSTLAQYLLYRRHLFAYEEACRQLPKGSVVADVGCGFGYALQMLLEKSEQVYAIDAADTALDALPDLPGVKKIKSLADAIPLDSQSVDCVIAFQLLEHLPMDSVGKTLKEFVRLLRPGGRIYATTPNSKWRLYPGQKPWNPYHCAEYSAESLGRVCSAALSSNWRLRSVKGIGIAQDIELARVSPDPVRHLGPGFRSYLMKAWQYYGTPKVVAWRKLGNRPVEQADRQQLWFELCDDPSQGLDLWLEINK
jgi:ubiquinone/menaquinone biosynthesis C-methylase UbiE